MYAVKRQLSIWKHEMLEAWDRIPFYGRIFLGVAVAISLSLLCIKQELRPLNEELASLRKDLLVPKNLDPEQDEEIIMNRDRAAKLQESLKSWRARLGEFESEAVYLRPEVHLQVVSAVQDVLNRCGLQLVSEQLVLPEPEQPAAKKRGRSRVEEKPKRTEPLDYHTHHYEIRGSFRQIQAFLLLIEPLQWRLTLRDLELTPVGAESGLLALRFNLDIQYLKEKP